MNTVCVPSLAVDWSRSPTVDSCHRSDDDAERRLGFFCFLFFSNRCMDLNALDNIRIKRRIDGGMKKEGSDGYMDKGARMNGRRNGK